MAEAAAAAPTWLTDTLWPAAHRTGGWWGGATERFVAVPSSDAPTQLLPWSAASCRAATQRRSDDRPRFRSMVDGAGVLGLVALAPFRSRSRLALRTSGTDSLVAHLRDHLDRSIRSAVVLCGPMRANQKPVLQLLDRWGATVAFAKVSWNPLTRELLDAERAALEHLAGVPDRGFVVPRVLGSGEFSGGAWLAISPATVRRRVRACREGAFALARAIERTGAASKEPSGAFADQVTARAADLSRAGSVVAALSERAESRQLALCASHGDFVPWNILSGVPDSAVWDWERYDQHRPQGYDRLHFAFQVEVARRGRTASQAADAVLAELGLIVPELDRSIAALHFEWYLADVMCRYERDGGLTGVGTTATRAVEIAELFAQRGSLG